MSPKCAGTNGWQTDSLDEKQYMGGDLRRTLLRIGLSRPRSAYDSSVSFPQSVEDLESSLDIRVKLTSLLQLQSVIHMLQRVTTASSVNTMNISVVPDEGLMSLLRVAQRRRYFSHGPLHSYWPIVLLLSSFIGGYIATPFLLQRGARSRAFLWLTVPSVS